MKYLFRWLPAASLVSFIHYLSSRPSLNVVPKSWLPLWLVERLAAYTIKIGTTGFFSYTLTLHPEFVVRKLGHFAVFGLLGAAFFIALQSKHKAILLSVLMAAVDEMHQGLVPSRDCRFWDIVVDSVGSVCGILAMAKLFYSNVTRNGFNDNF